MAVHIEIGSEFWDVPVTDKTDAAFFPQSTQWFISGRSALQAIIKELNGCHTVAMPSWCCDSMIKPFVDAGLDVHFYPVYWKNGLVQEIRLDCDALFIMDYFGYSGSLPDLKGFKGITVRDVTHSIFSDTYTDADYYFGSLRKWCGVWTGGYAWTEDGHKLQQENTDDGGYAALREKAMQLKNRYIRGCGVTDKGYLKLYGAAEECLENVGVAPAAERDIRIAERLDVETIKAKRRENAEVLRSSFPNWLVFKEMNEDDCPMFVPVLVPDGKRDPLRRYLINNGIYCPIHWPVSEYHRLDEQEQFLYDNELSLVCDQRYTKEDMNRMAEAIKTFMEE
ncbi:MAG: hypothetical protein PUB32_02600 [Clostridiales bacterium]|nr:hypothetical protein [Clostridiales bacterium]